MSTLLFKVFSKAKYGMIRKEERCPVVGISLKQFKFDSQELADDHSHSYYYLEKKSRPLKRCQFNLLDDFSGHYPSLYPCLENKDDSFAYIKINYGTSSGTPDYDSDTAEIMENSRDFENITESLYSCNSIGCKTYDDELESGSEGNTSVLLPFRPPLFSTPFYESLMRRERKLLFGDDDEIACDE